MDTGIINTLNKAPDVIDWALQNSKNSGELLIFISVFSLILITLSALSVLIYKWLNFEKIKTLKLKEKELNSYSKQIPILFEYINRILELSNMEMDNFKNAIDKILDILNFINGKINNNISKNDFIIILKFLIGKESGFLTSCVKEIFDKFDNTKDLLLTNDNNRLDTSAYNELINNCYEIIKSEWNKVNHAIINLNIDKSIKADINNIIISSKLDLERVLVEIKKYLFDNYIFDHNNKVKFKQYMKNQLSKFTNDVYTLITDNLNKVLED